MTKSQKIEKHAKEQPTRVEFSQDGGRSWRVWCFGDRSTTVYRRLIKLYPSWDFTLITPKGQWSTYETINRN